jgi:type I restriction enzyme S subunit
MITTFTTEVSGEPGPGHSEQRAIADFLDRECERVSQLTATSSSLDSLSAEAYERMLRDEVGHDEWPHVRLSYVARTGTGHTPSRAHSGYWASDELNVPWFTLADVWQIRDDEREEVKDTTERISEVGLANSAAVKHPEGTVILSRTASVGFSAVMACDMAVSQDFMTWTCGPKIEPVFLLSVLRAMRPELRQLMTGSTHKTIYMPDLHALRVPLPPVAAQRRAVAGIRRSLEPHWRLRRRNAELRERLAEYRDALITEAVTGQLDVTRVSEQQMDERAHAAMEEEPVEAVR